MGQANGRVLNPSQRAALERASAACNMILPAIGLIEAGGAVSDILAARGQELRSRRDLLARLCEALLAFDDQAPGMIHSTTPGNPYPKPVGT